MKVTVYVGVRNSSGNLENIRRWEDIAPAEQKSIGQKLQIQCAESIGYQLKGR